MSDKIFQEDPEQKAQWLAYTKKVLPLGTRVKVLRSDRSVRCSHQALRFI